MSGGGASGFNPIERIVVKYTNPDKKGNVITLSKNNRNPFFETYITQHNCAIVLNSFSRLSIVFTKAENFNADTRDKAVFTVEDINEDFRVSFDTKGDNYNIFLVFDNLDIHTEDSGQFEDPSTCAEPYGYVTFKRFN